MRRAKSLEHLIFITDKPPEGVLSFKEVAESRTKENSAKLEKLQKEIQFDDPVNIQFTSGTTGNPKSATLMHFNMVNNARMMAYCLHYQADVRN